MIFLCTSATVFVSGRLGTISSSTSIGLCMMSWCTFSTAVVPLSIASRTRSLISFTFPTSPPWHTQLNLRVGSIHWHRRSESLGGHAVRHSVAGSKASPKFAAVGVLPRQRPPTRRGSKQAFIPVPSRKIAPYVQVMSIESKRGEGAAEELGGTIKKVAGKVLGNEQMEAEGRAKEAAGEAKQEAAKAAGRTEGKIEEVVGAVKNRIGQVIDNEQMAAEGKVKPFSS